jgi:hypothetical protein
MATRHEITKKYTREYKRASKKDKGRMLDRARRGHGLVADQRPARDH